MVLGGFRAVPKQNSISKGYGNRVGKIMPKKERKVGVRLSESQKVPYSRYFIHQTRSGDGTLTQTHVASAYYRRTYFVSIPPLVLSRPGSMVNTYLDLNKVGSFEDKKKDLEFAAADPRIGVALTIRWKKVVPPLEVYSSSQFIAQSGIEIDFISTQIDTSKANNLHKITLINELVDKFISAVRKDIEARIK